MKKIFVVDKTIESRAAPGFDPLVKTYQDRLQAADYFLKQAAR